MCYTTFNALRSCKSVFSRKTGLVFIKTPQITTKQQSQTLSNTPVWTSWTKKYSLRKSCSILLSCAVLFISIARLRAHYFHTLVPIFPFLDHFVCHPCNSPSLPLHNPPWIHFSLLFLSFAVSVPTSSISDTVTWAVLALCGVTEVLIMVIGHSWPCKFLVLKGPSKLLSSYVCSSVVFHLTPLLPLVKSSHPSQRYLQLLPASHTVAYHVQRFHMSYPGVLRTLFS